MNLNDEWIKDKKKVAQFILDKLKDRDLPNNELEVIQGWLFSDDNVENKTFLLAKILKNMIEKQSMPDTRAYELLLEFYQRAGIVPIKQAKPIPLYRRAMFRVAAVIIPLLLVAGTAFFLTHKDRATAEQTIVSVPATSEKEIVLPDGSTVTIKENTTLAYDENFTENRRVEVEGEAFFSVAHDEARPFTVENNGMTVTVLGTQFNVKAYRNEPLAEVVLISGNVSLQIGSESVVMQPHQKAAVNRTTSSITLSEAGEGKMMRVSGAGLTFHSKNLKEALHITADYFGKILVLEKEIDSEDPIYIESPARTSLSDIMQSIGIIAETIEYQINGDTIIVTSR